MSNRSPIYNLYEPDSTDDFDDFLEEFNQNMETIDQNLGGGGTYVEANPAGSPTDVLNSIQIGSTIYSIGGGGGGHTIVNESGTSLPSETKLQFTDGLQAVDDNVNGKTVVSLTYFAVVGGELCQVYDDGN